MKQKVTPEILKKLFQGIHGLVPTKPREPLTGKVSDSRLVKRSK